MPFKTEAELEEIKQKLHSIVWPLVSDVENANWKLKGGSDREVTGLVYNSYDEAIGVIWKMEVVLDMTPQQYFEDILMKPEMLDWVPSLADYKIVERSPDKDWEVTYSHASKFGPVSARDFVNINFYKKLEDGPYYGMIASTEHPDYPAEAAANKGIVRGEYLPSATYIMPWKENPKKSIFYWLNNVDMKGLLPRPLINLAMNTVMLDLAAALIGKSKRMNNVTS